MIRNHTNMTKIFLKYCFFSSWRIYFYASIRNIIIVTASFNKLTTGMKRRCSAAVSRKFTLFKMLDFCINRSFFGFEFIFKNI